MGRSSYKAWTNTTEPGACVFVTTTCLDFVHLFAQPKLADMMAGSLLSDLRHHQANRWAFVVMPHHIHALFNLPPKLTVSSLMNQLKSNSARRLIPLIDRQTWSRFDHQRGLNGRVIWQRSFRAFRVDQNKTLAQKMRYIHENPVRAGLVERSEDYKWSSAGMWLSGMADCDGLPITDGMIEEFASMEELDRLFQK